MGMGIPIPVGFPWGSHGNGTSFGLLIGNGNNSNGNVNSIYYKIPTGSVNSLLFLHMSKVSMLLFLLKTFGLGDYVANCEL